MRVFWLDLLVLAALGLAATAAAPPAGRADETGADAEVSVPATEERSSSTTNSPPGTCQRQ